MIIDEKLDRITKLRSRINELQTFLNVVQASRGKKNKVIEYDSYPSCLKLYAQECTGSQFSTRGDVYDSGIKDRETLVKILEIIVPFLEERKAALTLELTSLLV